MGSSADGLVQRHMMDIVARVVGVVGIVVIRFIHSLGVEERRQFLKQTERNHVVLSPYRLTNKLHLRRRSLGLGASPIVARVGYRAPKKTHSV